MGTDQWEAQADKLRVFVSSTMAEPEFKLIRKIIEHELTHCGIEPWLYETQVQPGPQPVFQYCREAVDKAAAYVAIFKERLGAGTREEFEHARGRRIGLFVYILNHTVTPDPALEAFLSRLRDPQEGVVCVE